MTDLEAARKAMVDCQVRPSDVTRFAIIEAMLWAPRERFVPRAQRPVAYADMHIPLGAGRALLDARTFAKMLDAAAIGRDDLVLDVGSGLGYSAVVAARMAAAVVALEADVAMTAQIQAALSEFDVDNVVVETGPLTAGAPQSGPYDVILVEGAVAAPPAALLGQLKPGGRLVGIVQDGAFGQARLFVRTGDGVSSRRLFDAAAPLLPGFEPREAFQF
jgi:protein-L-isoaspartate(D-aspartate) O-methyltransferase